MSAAAHATDADGHTAARTMAALWQRHDRALVGIGGDDHRKFLQGLVTSNIEELTGGSGCRSLFLDTKGHVRGTLDIWALDDAVVAGVDIGFLESALPDLQKYVLGSAVTFDDLRESMCVIGLVGPESEAVLRAAGIESPSDAAYAHAVALFSGADVRLARTLDLGAQSVELHVPAGVRDEVFDALAAAGATAISATVAEVLRVEAGVVRFGFEVSGAEFPQEAGLDDAIDYEKGCYLGQETVARIHYRGQVNRLLRGVRGNSPFPRDSELVSSGEVVGRVTSSVVSPQHGSIGLAYVRREDANGGTPVEIRTEDGNMIAGSIVELPFSA